jgi:membrane protease YdiL (CAAX protease family)
MYSARGEPSGRPNPWQEKAWVQLLAIMLGVLPLYSSLIIAQLWSDQPISLQGFILYLAVISPLAIVIALLALRLLCGERPRDLNRKPGKVSSDLLSTLILSIAIVVANVLSTSWLAGLLPKAAASASVRDLFMELAGDPTLLVLFVGLLLMLGAASEEIVRAFLLSRMWRMWPSTPGKLVAVVVSAVAFGLIHVYRGPVHVAWASIFGLLMGLYYLRFGRVVPLILAHYVTNAMQVIVFAALAG